jgi:hypothetical protein
MGKVVLKAMLKLRRLDNRNKKRVMREIMRGKILGSMEKRESTVKSIGNTSQRKRNININQIRK